MKETTTQPERLTVREFAQRIKKSTPTVYDLINSGKINSEVIGSKKYVIIDELSRPMLEVQEHKQEKSADNKEVDRLRLENERLKGELASMEKAIVHIKEVAEKRAQDAQLMANDAQKIALLLSSGKKPEQKEDQKKSEIIYSEPPPNTPTEQGSRGVEETEIIKEEKKKKKVKPKKKIQSKPKKKVETKKPSKKPEKKGFFKRWFG